MYGAPAIAMAVLETAAHIDDAGFPLNRFLVRMDVPDRLWSARTVVDMQSLPAGWVAIPAGKASVEVGAGWWRDRAGVCLQVPSVIVPEECVVMLNPLHPDAGSLVAHAVRAFDYGRLFRGA